MPGFRAPFVVVVGCRVIEMVVVVPVTVLVGVI